MDGGEVSMMQDMGLVYHEKGLRARTKDLTIKEAWATMHTARCTISLACVLALVREKVKR